MRTPALLLLTGCATAGTGLSAADLNAAMASLDAELRACLGATTEPVGGTVELTWVVEQDGSTGMVEVAASTVGDPNVEGCVAGVVRRNTFPRPSGEPFADARFTVDVDALGAAPAPATSGVLGPTAVNAVLAAHRTTLAGCLAAAQAGGREVTGDLELHWQVAPDGRVAWARVAAASVRDLAVERCLVSSMMTITFPPPEGGAANLSMPLKLL